jgi:hypothetical protein
MLMLKLMEKTVEVQTLMKTAEVFNQSDEQIIEAIYELRAENV